MTKRTVRAWAVVTKRGKLKIVDSEPSGADYACVSPNKDGAGYMCIPSAGERVVPVTITIEEPAK